MFNLVLSAISEIFVDTLTKNGKWSRMSIMMFICFNCAIVMAIIDFCFHGLRFDVWALILSLAYSTKIIDSYSNKIGK